MSLSATERAAWHISRERKSRRWRLEDLAQRVTGHGVPMTLNTLSKVERGELGEVALQRPAQRREVGGHGD